MPALRHQFPFLINTLWNGRAKRTVQHRRERSDLLLVNSYRAHKNMTVNGVVYIDTCKLVVRFGKIVVVYLALNVNVRFVSSSTDHSVRIWTLSGRYIGTLGSPISWEKLSSSECPNSDYDFRIPPDIKRIASSTTLQVSQRFV